MSWDCGLRFVFVPPVLQLGGVCALRDGCGGGSGGGKGSVCAREELTSRLGLEAVQRLAKDGCRLLQNHNYKLPDRNPAVSRVFTLSHHIPMSYHAICGELRFYGSHEYRVLDVIAWLKMLLPLSFVTHYTLTP